MNRKPSARSNSKQYVRLNDHRLALVSGHELPQSVEAALIAELQGLQTEIRTANRGDSIRALAGLGVALTSVLAPGDNVSAALLVAPLLLGALATYQLNSAAEVAGLAEYRDRTAILLNTALDFPVFNERSVQDQRRSSWGTLAAGSLIGVLCLGTMVWGLRVNVDRGGWYGFIQIATTTASLVAVAVAGWDFNVTRKSINRELDELGFAPFSPDGGKG